MADYMNPTNYNNMIDNMGIGRNSPMLSTKIFMEDSI